MDIVRSRQFGKVARRYRLEKGLTQADVAGLVGPHPVTKKWMNATQVSRVESGIKELDRWLIDRLIEILEMDPDEAWEAATGVPPGFTVEGYRKVIAEARSRPESSRRKMLLAAHSPRLIAAASAPLPRAA